MGLCCGKEAVRQNDQYQVEKETGRHVASQQEQLGFQFNIISKTSSNRVLNQDKHVVEFTLPKKGTELRKPGSQSILGIEFEDIKLLYKFGEQLGKGRSNITYRCFEIASGKSVACKSILKRKLSRKDKEGLKLEVEILKHLSGQPNIGEFHAVFEDRQSVHVVMELCEGGLLSDQITERGHYSEKDAAFIFKQIMNIVRVCHSMGVMHRDLKPGKLMLANKDGPATVKAIGFSQAIFFEEGEMYKDVVGSVFYVAPEVLQVRYGKEIDVWSAGVILYTLLSGFPPFRAETDDEIFDAIHTGNIDFESDPWPSISKSARDLVRRMLTHNPRGRITAAKVLEHPWINVDGQAIDVMGSNSITNRIKQFGETNMFKQLVLRVVAETFSEEDVAGIKNLLEKFDSKSTNNAYEELKSGLLRLGYSLSEADVQKLIKAVSVSVDGTIDYTEFIAAMIQSQKLIDDEHLHKAFHCLDIDNSGFITRDELEIALRKYKMGVEVDVRVMIEEADTDNDGKINYNELCALMRSRISTDEGLQKCASFCFST